MHQNINSKQENKHAYSFILSPSMLKYSRNTLPKENLLGQVEESHIGEQMLQILAEMLG
jgi:hypothetical protein